MIDSSRWGRPLTLAAFSIIAAACGSSEEQQGGKPDAGKTTDAGRDARTSSGGVPGAGGAGGSSGVVGAGGVSAGMGGMLGTGCTLGDAASDVPPGGGAEPDASTEMLPFDAGVRDASVADASAVHDAAVDAASHADAAPPHVDAGRPHVDAGPITYPPLRFSDIGTATSVSDQFQFTEGPVWDPVGQALYFTDINADSIYRLRLPDKLDVYANHLGNPDGLALDPDGNLIGAGFVARDIWRLAGGKAQSLVGEYRDRKLNSPDEVVVRSDGIIYFTDPTFGINGSMGFTAQTPELCFQGVYRLTSNALYLEDSTSAGPNGINFSPDEKTLYVSYTGASQVYRFDVAKDGSLSHKTLFASNVLIADSMCVDAGGNVYVASLSGITVLDPTGKSLGVIATPNETPTNCAFGGPDQRTLFITARVLVTAPAKGAASLWRIDDMPIPGLPGRP
ncbi:MAG TPA: SMP-30/gluconolactonase/LRE family protein [Polyangiaceae bacterium]|nr:SMP-30/gluconolactonase/LRE family protein [Polyangiaceae bacterium]